MTSDEAIAPSRAARVEAVLRQHFTPRSIEVEDESARHAGHAGARAGGETHYKVSIVSESFRGLSRVERSRVVYSVLSNEFAGGLHALSLHLRSPDEISSLKPS